MAKLLGSPPRATVLADKGKKFRLNFLSGLRLEHPLYNKPEARVARGEAVE
jgi:hypothetical protein